MLQTLEYSILTHLLVTVVWLELHLSIRVYKVNPQVHQNFNSHQEPVSSQACNPSQPHCPSLVMFAEKELHGTRFLYNSYRYFDDGPPLYILSAFLTGPLASFDDL